MSSTAAIYEGDLGSRGFVAPRRLGGVFSPIRNMYLLYLPLCMSFVGLLCWVVQTDAMLITGSVMLSLVSLYLFYDLTVRQAPLRITTLLVTTLGLAYGLGTANTWFTLPRAGQELGAFLHKDPLALTYTMGSILFVMSVLLAAGEFIEKPLFGEEFELHFPPQSIVFITAGVSIIIVAFARGSLNFMGASVGESGNLGVFASFASWLVSTLFAVTLVAALNVKSKGLKRYLLLLTLVQFVLVIPLGRRVLIYTVVLAVTALRLGHFRFNWSWPKRLLVGAVLAGTLYAATIGFYYLRLAGFASGRTHLSIIERVTLAYSYFQNKDFEEVQKSFSKNVQGRTFILGFLAELEDYSTHFTPGYGRNLEEQFLKAVPSAIYPTKDRNFEEEGLANELFGSAYIDEANSVLTGGAVDFGFIGMVFYPLLVCFMLRIFFEFLGQTVPTFVATFVIFAGLFGLLQPENAITEYFIVIRNGLLFGTVVWFFIALPAFRLRKEN